VVTSTADSGTDTLRDAINLANATPGPDTIAFNIAGTGPHQISLLTKLPDILESVINQRSTQPGYVANTLSKGSNAQPQIELTTAAGVTRGLNILADGVTIRGMIVPGSAAMESRSASAERTASWSARSSACGATALRPKRTRRPVSSSSTGRTALWAARTSPTGT
jgi:hypothetical protein